MTYIEIASFSVQEQKFPVNSMKESCFLLRNLLALSNYLSSIPHMQDSACSIRAWRNVPCTHES